MNNPNYTEMIQIDIHPGIHIEVACKEALKLASSRNVIVSFDFNGCRIKAHPDMKKENVISQFYNKDKK